MKSDRLYAEAMSRLNDDSRNHSLLLIVHAYVLSLHEEITELHDWITEFQEEEKTQDMNALVPEFLSQLEAKREINDLKTYTSL